jgi:hypothetical protein
LWEVLLITSWLLCFSSSLAKAQGVLEHPKNGRCKVALMVFGVGCARQSYEAVPTEFAITFGKPIPDIFDIANIIANHDMCTYYNTLCALTTDPQTCMNRADGAGGCNVTM